jgi:ABC-type amino acid transport substrate-binding protein
MGRWAWCCLIAMVLGGTSCQAAPLEYSIGVEENEYKPLHYLQDGEYQGAFREILDEFARDQGIHFVYKPLPINRLLQSFLIGDVDFKFPDNSYWNADLKQGKQIIYSDPLCDYIDGVFVLSENVQKKEESIRTLGTLRGFTPIAWLPKIQNGTVVLTEVSNVDALLRLVQSKRVDGGYVSVSVGISRLQAISESNVMQYSPNLPHTKSSYFFSSIKHPAVVIAFNKWMVTHHQHLQELKDHYGVERGVYE